MNTKNGPILDYFWPDKKRFLNHTFKGKNFKNKYFMTFSLFKTQMFLSFLNRGQKIFDLVGEKFFPFENFLDF